ncbi:ATP-binding protein [Luteimicrobium subarcticum]|uniref:ATP-binding protein n=1 Tax=Luteimicrobium subarcticum TaxID=620910 RepID=A0A2M8WSK4_9MICO|nr:DUF4143 domain-containing protein [Luteimicrobium subarcticum]PJI93909.1 hypothetical protein CLV34_1390 [Luteimicrobium subarcticum]
MYRRRVVDAELSSRMRAAGAVLIEGPKACGKTATAQQVATTTFRMDLDDGARRLVGTAPEVLLAAAPPVLFDEWQETPRLWNLVRREVDDEPGVRGRYLLTGSATPDDDTRRHSGAGRYSYLRMRPMSLFERGVSTGAVSLRDLFDGTLVPGLDPGVGVPQLVDQLVIGGWPDLLDATARDAQQWLADYLRTVVEVDLPRLGVRRDPATLLRLLASLARGVGTQVTVQSLSKDVGGADGPLRRGTVADYLEALERLMLTEDLPAWGGHMRSTTPLRKSPTRYMVDPSLGVAALGRGPEQLLHDMNATGFHFEAMVVRDLRIYAQPLGGHLSHWRDNNGHEVDVVVTLADGRWGALEVRMGPDSVDSAAASLLRFQEKVDVERLGAPVFLGVVTTRTAAYRRPDGVYVLPVAALGP